MGRRPEAGPTPGSVRKARPRTRVFGRVASRCRVAQGSHGPDPGCYPTPAEVSDGGCAPRFPRCGGAPRTRCEGSDLEPEERREQDLAEPHGRGQAAGGDGEGDRDDAFDADTQIAATGTFAVVPERITATESGDHGLLPGGWGTDIVPHD